VGQREQRYLLALGLAVAQIREERGTSAEQLATATGAGLAHVQALEAGRLDPTYELLLMLAEGLGVRASAFVIRAEALLADDG
jgi:transcriptional regulator with XRE-family HTH domain